MTSSAWNIPSWSVADIIFSNGMAQVSGMTASLATMVTLSVADIAATSQSSMISSCSRGTITQDMPSSMITGTSACEACSMPVAYPQRPLTRSWPPTRSVVPGNDRIAAQRTDARPA